MKTSEYLANRMSIERAKKYKEALKPFTLKLFTYECGINGNKENKIVLILPQDVAQLKSLVKDINKKINDYENSFEDVYVLNEYLKLKYEKGQTHIYINNEYFRQCTYLLLNIPEDEIERFDDIKSIDDAEGRLSHELHGRSNKDWKEKEYGIDPKQEFIAHCSNLQAWVENDYNTQILHRTLAFPILKRLVEVGDPKAKRSYKEELAYRLESNELTVIIYLIQNRYLKDLTNDEIEVIIDSMKPGVAKIILQYYLEVNFNVLHTSNRILPSNYDTKKMALILVKDEVYLTSFERNSFTFNDYKKPFRLKVLDKYSRVLHNSLIDFGITWNQYKVLFKKAHIQMAHEKFTNKDSILVEVPRSKAPLKLYVESENLAIFIYPKLMF